MSLRSNYTLVLEVTPTTPLTHGAGNRGNEQILRTTEYNLLLPPDEPEGEPTWRSVKVPGVSGSAMKSALRENAVGHLFEVLGLPDGSVDRDKLRLLLKGGKNDSGGQSVSLDEHRRLRDLFPLLAVFGSMDGGLPIRALIEVDPVRVWCEELVQAGILPKTVAAVEVDVDGEALVASQQIEVYPDTPPIPVHMAITTEQYYRHDMQSSPHVKYLEGQALAQIEDKAAERKGKIAKKEERREANESMPHSYQAIKPNTPMVTVIRLKGATREEWGCLMYAVTRWVQGGARLGGGATKGHGSCRVRVAGALRHDPSPGAVAAAGTALSVDVDTPERFAAEYVAHVRERADAIRAELGALEAA